MKWTFQCSYAQRHQIAVVAPVQEALARVLLHLALHEGQQVVAVDVNLEGLVAGLVALLELLDDVRLAGAASSVGSMSVCEKISLDTVPGLMTPGQRIAHGTRQPPSQLVSFSPRNGVAPPSGQLMTSAPLSVEYMTMVLSAMPSSSSLSSSLPTWPSCSTMPSG